MNETCWEIFDADISQWGSWCRLFQTSDGKFFVVDADVAEVPSWVAKVIRRNTAVFWCTENGGVTDLIADFEYSPMTSAEQAVQFMGYELTATPSADQLAQFEAAAEPPQDFGSTG